MQKLTTLGSMAALLALMPGYALVAQYRAADITSVMAAATGAHAQRPPAFRTPGFLGIGYHDITDEQVAALHLKGSRGVMVVLVDHDAPAFKAGLQPNDIIVNINGQPVLNMDSMTHMIHDAGAGATITMIVYRSGNPLKLTAQLGDQKEISREAMAKIVAPPDPPLDDEGGGGPSPDVFGQSFAQAPSSTISHQSFLSAMLHMTPFTGLAMEEMGPQLAEFFGAPGGTGLLVHTVLANSPAAQIGLRAGDVVLKADGMTLKSSSDWTRHLHAVKGKPIVLTVLRDKQQMQMTITPDLKHHSLLEWPHLY